LNSGPLTRSDPAPRTVTKVGFVAVPGTRTEGPSDARTQLVQRVRVLAARTAEIAGESELAGPSRRSRSRSAEPPVDSPPRRT